MSNIKTIQMNEAQAAEVSAAMKCQAIQLRTRANRLIHNTNNRQAGFNCLDLAVECQVLADAIDVAFDFDWEE